MALSKEQKELLESILSSEYDSFGTVDKIDLESELGAYALGHPICPYSTPMGGMNSCPASAHMYHYSPHMCNSGSYSVGGYGWTYTYCAS